MESKTHLLIDDLEQQKWTTPFFFVQMADAQFGMFWDANQGTSDCEPEIELTDAAVAKINTLKPLFCVMCGDFTQVGPNGGGRFGKGNIGTVEIYEKQVRLYKTQMAKINQSIPLICVCGNHDIENISNGHSLKKYNENFGNDYFYFWAGGCRFLVLNSTLLLKHENAQEQYKLQNDWIEYEFKKAANDSVTPHNIIFMHHPPALNDSNEKDEYFNSDSPINFPIDIRLPFLQLCAQSRIRAIFAGHYHRCAYTKYKDLEIITTSSLGFPLGNDKSGFAIVKVFKEKIEHQYYPLEEVPSILTL